MLLIDTCIWIDQLRGDERAAKYLQDISDVIFVSSLTVAELSAGAKKKKDQSFIQKMPQFFDVLNVNYEIGVLGGEFYRRFAPSHGAGIVDCLLAATAEVNNCTFVTNNKKHFPMLDEIIVPY